MIAWRRDKKCSFDGLSKDTGIVYRVSEMRDYRIIFVWHNHWLFVSKQRQEPVEVCKNICEHVITPQLVEYLKTVDTTKAAIGHLVTAFDSILKI